MKNMELPGLIPTEKPKPVPTPTPTTEEKEPWVWCPPAFEVELPYQHPEFPEKFISKHLLIKDKQKPSTEGDWNNYTSYFMDELVESRKINISRKKIREIIERFYDDKI